MGDRSFRRIDLENVERLRSFEAVTVVSTLEQLAEALDRRRDAVTSAVAARRSPG